MISMACLWSPAESAAVNAGSADERADERAGAIAILRAGWSTRRGDRPESNVRSCAGRAALLTLQVQAGSCTGEQLRYAPMEDGDLAATAVAVPRAAPA